MRAPEARPRRLQDRAPRARRRGLALILVTGFGPFGEVTRNPSGALARAVDGARLSGRSVVGVELPVRFLEGPDLAVAWARSCGARWVVGLGVASRRDRVSVERFATRATCGRPDIDGFAPPTCGDGPEHVPASLDPVALARALDAELSHDAGGYVCNAWLYRVTLALPEARVGFVHLPPAGLAPEALLRALAAMDQASSSS